mmetsp:Transcript_1408/g.3837  ORF Transcript_1408/g.3837 Transcript_1408/m.3837 type:complete len:168 (-) Transcript_1408:141-644(-)
MAAAAVSSVSVSSSIRGVPRHPAPSRTRPAPSTSRYSRRSGRMVVEARKDKGGRGSGPGPGSAPLRMETEEQAKAARQFKKSLDGDDGDGNDGGSGGGGGDDGDGYGEEGEGKQWIGLLLLAGCAGIYHTMQTQAGLTWSWKHFSYVRYVEPVVAAPVKRRESIQLR